ncbi:AAA domain-containing protein [Mycoplasmopsis adleri]|uniref:AAA domain-containing protein n=1 Tax=Mycoplasmopsis adleri TaxID=51362 RepID=UPI0038735366
MSNSWYGYDSDNHSIENKTKLFNIIDSLINTFDSLREYIQDIDNELKIDINNILEFKQIDPFFKAILYFKKLNRNIFSLTKLKSIIENLDQVNQLTNTNNSIKQELSSLFNTSIYKEDLADDINIVQNTKNILKRIFSSKYKKSLKKIKAHFNVKRIPYSKLCEALSKVLIVYKNQQLIRNHKSLINEFYPISENDDLFKLNEHFKNLLSTLNLFDWLIEYSYESSEKFDRLQAYVERITNSVFSKRYEDFMSLYNEYKTYFNKDYISIDNFVLEDFYEKLYDQKQNHSTIEFWNSFFKKLVLINSLGLRPFVEMISKINNLQSSISSIYEKSFLTQKLELFFNQNLELKKLNRLEHDKYIEIFKNKDKVLFELNRLKVICSLRINTPVIQFNTLSSDQSKLIKEKSKKSRKLPIRKLLKEIPDLIFTLKPIFLMSPVAVSTFFEFNKDLFDVVIFDEASQVFPWDALGAIGRAKQVIIVGDSKQMPPTNFFAADFDSEDDGYSDNSEVPSNFESILDYAAAFFPQNMLTWHYRSKNEDLINFSNWKFYNNRLTTFPSVNKVSENSRIEFIYLKNAVYERKAGINKDEANKIVDLICEHLTKWPNRSLGIVTFNSKQQALIEDLLEERAKDDHALYLELRENDKREPLFVKNLENVQGDERDTIILGVTFGYDADNKFINNFGPLNKAGGERRLNVAITRARINLKIVSSIRYFDISEDSKNIGPKIFRSYLEGAEKGMINVIDNNIINENAISESPFEEEVCSFLTSKGYDIGQQVGCSNYRIDIALKHKTNKDFFLAIECDGASYHSSKNARDRDRIRQEVLEKHGWKFYRIWSTDWFMDPITEKRRLIEAIEKALSEYESKSSFNEQLISAKPVENLIDFNEFTSVKEREIIKIEDMFKEYKIAGLKGLWFNNFVVELIQKESPVNINYIASRVRKEFQQFNKNDVKRIVFHRFKSFINEYDDISINQEIEYRKFTNDERYRKFNEIPIAELACGINVIVEQSRGISLDDLIIEIRKTQNKKTLGEREKEHLYQAIIYAQTKYSIINIGNKLTKKA